MENLPDNRLVEREPLDPKAVHQKIDDLFTFNEPLTEERRQACQQMSEACQKLAHLIAEKLPEGIEQTVCANSLLSVALWARHGVTRRQVDIVVVASPGTLSLNA
jgi:hypothetical protein